MNFQVYLGEFLTFYSVLVYPFMYRAALVIAALSYIEVSGKARPLWGHVCWFVVSGGWEMPLALRTGDARYRAKQRVVLHNC